MCACLAQHNHAGETVLMKTRQHVDRIQVPDGIKLGTMQLSFGYHVG